MVRQSSAPSLLENSSEWVESIFPDNHSVAPLLYHLADREFQGPNGTFSLSKTDFLLSGLVQHFLEEAFSNPSKIKWNVAVPRGENDLIILLGIFAQYIRLAVSYKTKNHPLSFQTPIYLIGKDTAVQRKLSSLSIGGVTLEEGLKTYRVRSNGKLDHPNSNQNNVQMTGTNQRLLYLNTRVGWPDLSHSSGGVALIDGTSFRSERLFQESKDWTENQSLEGTFILSELDQSQESSDIQQAIESRNRLPLTSRITGQTNDSSTDPDSETANKLTAKPLENQPELTHRTVQIKNKNVNEASITIRKHLKAASDLSDEDGMRFPRPLSKARSIYYNLVRLTCEIDTYDRSAALSPNHSSLHNQVESIRNTGSNDFPDQWHGYANTRWGQLKHTTSDLYEYFEKDNPKLMGLLDAILKLRSDHPDSKITIYTPSFLMSDALQDDLSDYIDDLGGWRGLDVIPWSQRTSWISDSNIALSVAVPPPWQSSLLQSSEISQLVTLVYPFEKSLLEWKLSEEFKQNNNQISSFFSRFDREPPPKTPPETKNFLEIDDDSITSEGEDPLWTFEVEELLASKDSEDTTTSNESVSTNFQSDPGTKKVVPLEFESDESVWYADANSSIEVLIGDEYRRVDPNIVTQGRQILVPKGENRHSLFERLVEAKEKDPDFQDVIIPVLERWRRCCRRLCEKCNNDTDKMRSILAEAGAEVTTQLEAWASGETIAPQNDRDIRAVAEAAESTWLKRQWQHISNIASEVRGLHIKIGKRLSKAMDEIPQGDGPNLQALTEILGTDPAEIIDEFSVKTLSRRHSVREVDKSLAGTLQSTGEN